MASTFSPQSPLACQFSPDIPFEPSPNYSALTSRKPLAVIIHHTGAGSLKGTVAWGRDPASKVSWHFILDRDGAISQQVGLQNVAWHAGDAKLTLNGRTYDNLNALTIGIELCNWGALQKTKSGFVTSDGRAYRGDAPIYGELDYKGGGAFAAYFEPYYEPQLKRLEALLAELKQRGYQAATSILRGHNEIALPPARKNDPGLAFPWKRFGRPADQLLVAQNLITPSDTRLA